MSTRLPGIKKICFLECGELPASIVERRRAGLPVMVPGPFTEAEEFYEATCESKTEWFNNGEKETATLKFKTPVALTLPGHTAWVLQDTNGTWWVIGNREGLFPSVEISATTGSPSGDAAVYNYTVKWVEAKALNECEVTEFYNAT